MPVLSWNIIRARAARFAKDWADACYEKGQTQQFYRDFFQLFGTDPRRLVQFEYAVKKLNKQYGFIDLFWPGTLLIEQKSARRDLTAAKEQAFAYFAGLKPEELPRYVLVSDFQRFELLDLQKRDENGEPQLTVFKLAELPKFVEAFAFIRGDVEAFLHQQKAVNIAASEHMGQLHKLLYQGNYWGEDLQIPLTRLVFCLFADSTSIFDEDGEPLFIGKSYQSKAQSLQLKAIAAKAGLNSGAGILDYVCAWFIKAALYMHSTLSPTPSPASGRGEPDYARTNAPLPLVGGREGNPPQIAFVATNSITQGEQVAQLWPLLLDKYRLEISFARRTFSWTSEAKKGMAHVHVVIIGLAAKDFAPENKILFSYPDIKGEAIQILHKVLSPYLMDAGQLTNPHLVVCNAKKNLMGYPPMMQGVKPVEGGHYIFADEQKQAFLQKELAAEKIFCPFTGAQEFINGNPRWILILQEAAPQELRKMPLVLQRIKAVEQLRLASPDKQVREDMALRPTTLRETYFPESAFLVFPEVSSENRDYIPIGYLNPPMIPSNLLRVLLNAELWYFAVLTSQIHMAWMRQFAGRLESRYRYSIGVVYNTFPWPDGLQKNKKAQEQLNKLAQKYWIFSQNIRSPPWPIYIMHFPCRRICVKHIWL